MRGQSSSFYHLGRLEGVKESQLSKKPKTFSKNLKLQKKEEESQCQQ
nr:MAG TPA: hypothetical protein [Caudoviricetes sp.]